MNNAKRARGKRMILVSLLAFFLVCGVVLLTTREALNMKEYTPTTDREKLAAGLRTLDPSEYGGMYSTNGGNTLIVNVLPDKPLQLSKNLHDVECRTVRYSLKELQDLRESLEDRMQEFNIIILSIDHHKNKLIIHVLRKIDQRIEQAIASYGGTEDMYEIIIDDEPLTFLIDEEERPTGHTLTTGMGYVKCWREFWSKTVDV